MRMRLDGDAYKKGFHYLPMNCVFSGIPLMGLQSHEDFKVGP